MPSLKQQRQEQQQQTENNRTRNTFKFICKENERNTKCNDLVDVPGRGAICLESSKKVFFITGSVCPVKQKT